MEFKGKETNMSQVILVFPGRKSKNGLNALARNKEIAKNFNTIRTVTSRTCVSTFFYDHDNRSLGRQFNYCNQFV